MSRLADQIVVVRLEGHLTREALDNRLAGLSIRGQTPLLVDCSEMEGYDAEARARFVDWHREHKGQIRAVAIVTDKSLWHMIVSAMSLASGQKMRAFESRDAAEAWLGLE